jgi:trans-2,3-dihydro-3-hydroxyanthranilate isomerase
MRPGTRATALEEGIGPVPIRLEGDTSAPTAVWMSHRDPEWGPELANRPAIAAALGLCEADLLAEAPVRIGSTGVEFLYVPLRSPEVVDRAHIDRRALSSANSGQSANVFVFAPDPLRGPDRVYSRMFAADSLGIDEDAATGSASGPLGAYVAERALVDMAIPTEIVSLQGNKMGRPSTIRIRVQLEDGRARQIEVGGGVVPVAEGVLSLPS